MLSAVDNGCALVHSVAPLLRGDVASGAMTEAFACGTAAVITPVGHVLGDDVDFVVNNNEAGKTTLALRERLTGIQRGSVEDTHGWLHTLTK